MDPRDAAVLARTSLQCASVAALTTYPRSASARPHLTNVQVTADEHGNALVLLRAGSLAVQQLLARPFATVHVAPRGCERVTLHGGTQRLPGKDHMGRLAFRVEAGAVRLGEHGQISIEAAAYAGARLDPLGRDAPAVLAHLRQPHHAEQLAACLRAAGREVAFAEPSQLDRYGLTVLAVGLDGVSEVRLPFPRPINKLGDLPPGLSMLLMCRCTVALSTTYRPAEPPRGEGG